MNFATTHRLESFPRPLGFTLQNLRSAVCERFNAELRRRLPGSPPLDEQVARCAPYPALTAEWLDFLATPVMALITARDPYLILLLHEPYLHRDLDVQGRLASILAHFDLLFTNLRGWANESLSSGRGLRLWRSPEDTYSVDLVYSFHRLREGALTLRFRDHERRSILQTMTFGFVPGLNGIEEIFIGGTQGAAMSETRERLLVATQRLHGWYPKTALLWTLQGLAAHWKLPCIRGVAETAHVSRAAKREPSFPSRYDDFWLRSGGVRDAPSSFALPLSRHPEQPGSRGHQTDSPRASLKRLLRAELQHRLTIAGHVV